MDISPIQMFWYAFGGGFIFALFPFMLTMRDFLNPYFATRFGRGKRLLAVHMPNGFGVVWRVGFMKDGMWQFNFKKGDTRSFSISDGSVYRTIGVSILHLSLGVTAPFNFKLVVPVPDKVLAYVLDDEGNKTYDESDVKQKSPLTEMVDGVKHVFFEACDDSKTLIACFESALSKKSSRASLSMGNIDFKRLLIIAAVIIGGIFVVKNFILSGQMPVIR